MKKFLLALIFMSLGLALESSAFHLPSHGPFDVYVPLFKGGLKFDFGVLYIRPNMPQFDYAVSLEDGDINYDSISPAYGDWSYEVGIGYDFPCSGNDIRLDFNRITQDDSGFKERGEILGSSVSHLAAPVFTDTVTVSSSGIPLPSATAIGSLVDPARLDFVREVIVFRQDRLDFELSQNLHLTRDMRIRYAAGIRGAKLENKFVTTSGITRHDNGTLVLGGTAIDPNSPTFQVPFIETVNLTRVAFDFHDEVNQKSDFSGAGPRFRIDANYYLDIGISLFASMSTALIVGEQHSSFTEFTTTSLQAAVADVAILSPDPTLVLTPSLTPGDDISEDLSDIRTLNSSKDIRVVPNLEARLGVSYALCLPCTCSRVFIEGGYMINHYFNAVDKLTDVSLNPNQSSDRTLDLTYDGVYLKLEMHV